MKKQILLLIACLFAHFATAQLVSQDSTFTQVQEIEGKVVFLREIAISQDTIQNKPYEILKKWVRNKYTRDPFYSSVRLDAKNNEASVVSRIDLLLPENKAGVREKITLKYRLNIFIFQNRKCVMEITDLSFLPDNKKKQDKEKQNKDKAKLPRMIAAENFITPSALSVQDDYKELRENTKKATLFFLNGLADDLKLVFAKK